MKHVLDALRDALPVVATLPGEGQAHISAGVGIKAPARQIAEQVLAAAAGLGVDAARFECYADRRWGPGWMRSASGRHRVLDEIKRYRNDPEGFADKIDAHLNLPGKPA